MTRFGVAFGAALREDDLGVGVRRHARDVGRAGSLALAGSSAKPIACAVLRRDADVALDRARRDGVEPLEEVDDELLGDVIDGVPGQLRPSQRFDDASAELADALVSSVTLNDVDSWVQSGSCRPPPGCVSWQEALCSTPRAQPLVQLDATTQVSRCRQTEALPSRKSQPSHHSTRPVSVKSKPATTPGACSLHMRTSAYARTCFTYAG